MTLVDQPLGDRLAGELRSANGDVGCALSFSRLIPTASNARSIRVLSLDTVGSVRE